MITPLISDVPVGQVQLGNCYFYRYRHSFDHDPSWQAQWRPMQVGRPDDLSNTEPVFFTSPLIIRNGKVNLPTNGRGFMWSVKIDHLQFPLVCD